MITIPSKIQEDLIDDINNFDIMVIITSANETFHISTKEQYFEALYFEDFDLRISALKESINFKSKKVKMSGTSITLNNYARDGVRFTDRAKYGILNATVEIYLKTGSCETLNDCAKLATLKVTRFDQGPEKVTLQCDEYLSESLHTELPKKEYTLYSEDNDGSSLNGKTYKVYNEQRIPILYGHLKEAPAITYIDNENGSIKVIPDRAMITGEEIGGVKSMMNLDDYLNDMGTGGQVTQLVDQDVMTVKLGDGGARVYKVHPKQAHGRLLKMSWDRQFDIYNDYVEFLSEDSIQASPYISQGALMVGELSKLKKVSSYLTGYSVHQSQEPFTDSDGNEVAFDNHFARYDIEDLNQIDNNDSDLFTNLSGKYSKSGVKGGTMQTADVGPRSDFIIHVPTMVFDFEDMKSSSSVYSDDFGVQTPADFNLISFIKISASAMNGHNEFSPHLGLCFFPGKSDQLSGGMVNDNHQPQTSWTAQNKVGFVDNVLSGAETDNDIGENVNISGLLDRHTTIEHTSAIKDLCPYRLKTNLSLETYHEDESNPLIDYRHPFNVPDNGSDDGEQNQWRNKGDWVARYPMTDVTSVVLNFVPAEATSNTTYNFYKFNINLDAEFYGMMLRRTWFQKDALNNKFYLNAKGKCKSYPNDNRTWGVDGMEIKFYSPNVQAPDGDVTGTVIQHDDLPLRYLLDYIGNDKLRYIYQDGIKSEVMIKVINDEFISGGDPDSFDMYEEIDYIFDLEINQLKHFLHSGNMAHQFNINGTLFRSSSLDFESNDFFTDSISGAYFTSSHIELWYCTKNIDGDGNITSIDEVQEVAEFREWLELYDYPGNGDTRVQISMDGDKIIDGKKIIRRPKNIINNLLDSEFGESSLISKNALDAKYELSFSIDKPQKTVDILQNIAQNTNFFYKTSISSSKPTIVGIKNAYNESDKTIFVDYIESYKFSKTKIEDLAIKCRVKYGYDYVADNYKNVTEEVSSLNIEDYKNFYGLSDKQVEGDDFLLEHEAPYIQDEPTANLLRDHLYELHKNQHTVVDFKINLSQGFELEVGDTINFATISDKDYTSFFSPYGVDIMTISGLPYLAGVEPDQAVLPFFMITEINKTMSSVSIKAIQLHALSGAVQVPDPPIDDDDDTGDDDTGDDDTGDDDTGDDLVPVWGDVDLDGNSFQLSDYDLMLSHTFGTPLSDQQIVNGDLNNYPGAGDGYIDALDLIAFLNIYNQSFMGGEINPGHLDGDDYITQNDVDLAQAYVDDPVANPLTLEQIVNGDIDNDGIVTQDDVGLITNMVKPIPGPVDPIGDLLIDTDSNIAVGVLSLYHEDNNIVIEISEGVAISESQFILEYMDELSSNDLTLIGTNITFQPSLTGELDSWPYYFWLGAAGDYTIESIVHIDNTFPPFNRFIITLDAPEVEGSNLDSVGAIVLYPGGTNDVNVKIYGTPISTNPDDGDGYNELLSLGHYYGGSVHFDFGSYSYNNGLQCNPQSFIIITDDSNLILPNATWPELLETMPGNIWNNSVYYRINITYNQVYEDFSGPPSETDLDKINSWLYLDGVYMQKTGANPNFLRFGWDTLLDQDGNETTYNYASNQSTLTFANGHQIGLNQSEFQLTSECEDYIYLTVSYPSDIL